MFDSINKILYKPQGSEVFVDDDKFSPFMIQRWGSMHSTPIALIINQTSNRYWSVMKNDEMWYKFFHAVIPKVQFKRINYIKKKKAETVKKKDDRIQKVAAHLEISTREVSQYVEDFNLHIPHEQKTST